jgi:hypothetical protein
MVGDSYAATSPGRRGEPLSLRTVWFDETGRHERR